MNSRYNLSIVRNLRHRRGLTLKQLAAKSGITYATLEKVETNKTAPSLKTLHAIASGLGIPTGELITLSEKQIVWRSKVKFVTGEYSEKINPGIENCKVGKLNNVKVLRFKAQNGINVKAPQLHENCNAICCVLSGCLDLIVSGETYRLNADDCILFDGMLDHTYEQIEAGEYIAVHIPKDAYSIKNSLIQADDQESE